VNAADIEGQAGAAAGLWTHVPVDWAGNEGLAKPGSWPSNAAQGYRGINTGTRPGSTYFTQTGIPGTVVMSAVSVTAIGTTTASVTFTLNAAPTSSRVNYGTTEAVTLNAAGTTATQQTVALSGLTSKTLYYYSVQATNPTGTSVTGLLTFTTL
jgi:hypothetical protein